MMKWSDKIPFNSGDLKFYYADELARRIEECYSEHNASIKIRKEGYDPRYGNGFKFEVNLKYGTSIEKVKKLIPTVQLMLKLPAFQAIQEGGILYFTTATVRPVSSNNSLEKILKSEKYISEFEKMEITHPVGVDFDGNMIICDLAEYPHAMVSGTTKSGKSTALKCLLVSLLKYSPDKMNFIIADRGAELSKFDGLPHLSYPIIYKPEELAYVFLCLKDEMERRNVLRREDEPSYLKLPYIVCVIDEFPWFIKEIDRNKRTEKVVEIINDILRFGRNTKIHLVLSIHDPKDEISIIEKGDIPVGLTFQTVNSRKSMNALGGTGADKFSGSGEMNFHYRGKDYHLQGVYMDDNKMSSAVQYIKGNFSDCESPKGEYGFLISGEELAKKKAETDAYIMNFASEESKGNKNDEAKERKFVRTVLWVLSQKSVSINTIQNAQSLSVGNKYAKDFFDKLLSLGIIGDSTVDNNRHKVLPQSIEEIPSGLKDILSRNGISDDEIMSAIGKRIIASGQKKGAKPTRAVEQDMTKELSKNHDYGEDVNKEECAKPLETLSMQNDVEPKQEQTIMANDEEIDTEAHVEDAFHEVNNSTYYSKKGLAH
ncbi:MAG: hypothetical protein HFJ01_16255 [Lachnospiraceae bacterium]|jgi:hypothetical protein|nr:hypothetical protein [Lachnospiraceae bacterium]